MIVGHSYGGLVVRLYAMTYPEDVDGMVLVDALSEGLREAETPEEWVRQKKILDGDLTGDPQALSRHRAGGCRRQFRSTARGRAAPADASGRAERRPSVGTACPEVSSPTACLLPTRRPTSATSPTGRRRLRMRSSLRLCQARRT